MGLTDKIETILFSKKYIDATSKLRPPIPYGDLADIDHLEMFLKCYITKFDKAFDVFYWSWMRILKSSSSDLLNRALVTTTAIEGILKQYLKDFSEPDEAFTKQVKDAEKIIKDLKIGERIKSRLLGNLNMSQLFSAKGALHGLKAKGYVANDLIEMWNTLRNKAAHPSPSIAVNSEEDLQKLLDQTYACQVLFYILLMVHIGYEGKIIEYSKDEWPSVPMYGPSNSGSNNE